MLNLLDCALPLVMSLGVRPFLVDEVTALMANDEAKLTESGDGTTHTHIYDI